MRKWNPNKSGMALVSVLTLFRTASLLGQDTEEAAKTDDEIVELSPYVVDTSKDVGYIATNSISGTRLNMPIKDVPMNLEVITGKFIQDTGATNLRDALRYSPGIVLQSQNDAFPNGGTGDVTTSYSGDPSGGTNNPEGVTRTAGDSATKMRGAPDSYVLQDGFHRVFADDTINVERVEVLRGPSALLYGSGNVGGVINYITKKPVFGKQIVHIGTTVGSYSLLRGELDVNIPLASSDSKYQPAIRVMGAMQTNENNTDYYEQKLWQYNIVFSIKPIETMTLTLGAEFGYKEENGNGFQNMRAASGAAGSNQTWWTDIRSWDTEAGSVISADNPDIDKRTFRWSGPDCYSKGPYSSFTADLEQKLGEYMFFKTGYMHSRSQFQDRQIITNPTDGALGMYATNDSRGTSVSQTQYTSVWTDETYMSRGGVYTPIDGTNGTYTGGVFGTFIDAGTFDKENQSPNTNYRETIAYYWQDLDTVTNRDQVRAELVFKYDAGDWGNHTLITGMTYEKVHTVVDQYRPPETWSETYYDDNGRVVALTDGSHQVQVYDQYSYKNPSDYSVFTYGTQGDGIADNPAVHWLHSVENNWNLAYFSAYQGQFFNNSLTFVGGLRWDRMDNNKVKTNPYVQSLVGKEDPYGKLVTIGQVPVVYSSDEANTAVSPQIGLSYALTSNLSIFGVYSEGSKPNYWAIDGDGQMLDPEKSKSYEVGIKFDFFDGKLSGTISAYKLTRENVPYFVWWAPNPFNDVYNGYDETQPTKLLWTYTTPDAFYDMFAFSGLDYDTCLATIKENWPEAYWDSAQEVYQYCKDNGVNAENGADLAQYWNWGEYGPESNSFGDWSFYNRAMANTQAPVEGETEYCPLIALDDANTIALFTSKNYSGTWTGNIYAGNGTTYLYYDPVANTSKLTTGNSRGSVSAYVPMSDQAKGWDMTLTWQPIPEFSMTAGFSHLNRIVTSKRYVFVDAEYTAGAQWYSDYGAINGEPGYLTYGDMNDASTYYLNEDGTLRKVMDMYGHSCDDSPENTATLWSRYELKHMLGSTPFLKNIAIGLGGQWNDKREWFSGFMGGGNVSKIDDGSGDNSVLIVKWCDQQYTFNGMIEYTTKLQEEKYNLRVALNVDNILNDTKEYGNLYGTGISAKLSASIDF